MWNFIKTNFLSLLVLALFLFILFRPSGCGGNDDLKEKRDTVIIREYYHQPVVNIPPYIPVESKPVSYPVVIPPSYNPSGDIAKLTEQYNNLLKEYLAVRSYQDSVVLKDTSGNRVGVVNLNDEISENKFKSRQPSYQLSFPSTTTTITIREPYVPRNQIYAGFGISGNQISLVDGAYVGLMFKNKKDRVFGASAGVLLVNGKIQPQFGLSTYWKIKLK